MTANEFIAKAESELGKVFPELVVRLFPDPDDDSTFFAYMFCVPDGTEQDVKSRAREFIRGHLKGDADWSIIPAVKSLSVTKEHYPQYLKTQPADGIISNAKILPLMIYDGTTRVPYSHPREVFADADYIGCVPCVIQPSQVPHDNRFKLAA